MNKNLIDRVYRKVDRECTVKQARVACLVTLSGQPWFITTNKRGSGKVSRWTHHAEELAVKRVKAYQKALSIPNDRVEFTVMRFKYDGSLGLAMPCPGCRKILDGYTYHYSDDRGDFFTVKG